MYLKKAIVPVFISLLLLPSNRIIDTSMVIDQDDLKRFYRLTTCPIFRKAAVILPDWSSDIKVAGYYVFLSGKLVVIMTLY